MHQRWIQPVTAVLSSSLALSTNLTTLASVTDAPLTLLERQMFAGAELGALRSLDATPFWTEIFLPNSGAPDAAPPLEAAAAIGATPPGAAVGQEAEARSTDLAAKDGLSARVRVVATSGPGCAEQKASVGHPQPTDASAFNVHFSGYSAAQGPDNNLAQAHCVFAIDIQPPPGMTYAVTQVSLGGKVELQPPAMARAAVQYFYQGVPRISSFERIIRPSSDGWQTPGVFAPDDVQHAPCGGERLLFLNTSLVVIGELDAMTSRVSVDPALTVRLALAACE
jgi:hypothetical protein